MAHHRWIWLVSSARSRGIGRGSQSPHLEVPYRALRPRCDAVQRAVSARQFTQLVRALSASLGRAWTSTVFIVMEL